MRQYAGYASAKESNERYKYLLAHGSTGLSMAFDLPTQLGLDSDDPRCLGEVGRTGVAIDTIEDMRTAFDGIPLDEVSTSMTINAPAAVLLLLYELVGEEQGVAPEKLRGTVQNDILKEYIARGNFIYPPEPSMRLTTDLFAYCQERDPAAGTRSRSPATTSARRAAPRSRRSRSRWPTAWRTCRPRSTPASKVDDFAPRLAFFFNGHNNVFQEVAKFRAARSMWARVHARPLRRDRRALADDPLPHADRRRDAHRPAAAQQRRARRAAGLRRRLRRHAVAAHQRLRRGARAARPSAPRRSRCAPSRSSPTSRARPTPSTRSPAPTTSSRSPTRSSARAGELIEKIDELGGSVEAIAFIKNEIEESAFGYHERYRTGQDIVVGVNKYVDEDVEVEDILRVDPEAERDQVERLKAFKAEPRPGARGAAPRGAARPPRGHREPAAAHPRRRSRTAARSARCAARCARSSASTSPRCDQRFSA